MALHIPRTNRNWMRPFWVDAKATCALNANTPNWTSWKRFANRDGQANLSEDELQKLYETYMREPTASSPAARSASSPTRRPLNTHTAANSSPAETAKRNTAARAAAHATRPPLRPPGVPINSSKKPVSVYDL